MLCTGLGKLAILQEKRVNIKQTSLTRASIGAAARASIAKGESARLVVSDVARMLGVSHAALYRHVDGKRDLALAALEPWLAEIAEIIACAAAEESEPALAIERCLVDLHLALVRAAGENGAQFELYALLVPQFAQSEELLFGFMGEWLSEPLCAGLVQALIGHLAPGDPRLQEALAVLEAVSFQFLHPRHVPPSDGARHDERLRRAVRAVLRAYPPKAG